MKNIYYIDGDIAVIEIINRAGTKYEVKIDKDDLPLVSRYAQWRRFTHSSSAPAYAATSIGTHTTILLHRLLLNAERWEHVNFVNGDTWDCRRANLQIRGKPFWTDRGYRVWKNIGGRNTYFGTYADQADAEKAYRLAQELDRTIRTKGTK